MSWVLGGSLGVPEVLESLGAVWEILSKFPLMKVDMQWSYLGFAWNYAKPLGGTNRSHALSVVEPQILTVHGGLLVQPEVWNRRAAGVFRKV